MIRNTLLYSAAPSAKKPGARVPPQLAESQQLAFNIQIHHVHRMKGVTQR